MTHKYKRRYCYEIHNNFGAIFIWYPIVYHPTKKIRLNTSDNAAPDVTN